MDIASLREKTGWIMAIVPSSYDQVHTIQDHLHGCEEFFPPRFWPPKKWHRKRWWKMGRLKFIKVKFARSPGAGIPPGKFLATVTEMAGRWEVELCRKVMDVDTEFYESKIV